MKILVEALETYKKNNIRDNELGRVPEPGERFEVTEERLNVLLGDNNYHLAFVKVVDDKKTEKENEEVTEEVVQAVAEAIVEQAEEDNSNVETVVKQIVEEKDGDEKRRKKKSRNYETVFIIK